MQLTFRMLEFFADYECDGKCNRRGGRPACVRNTADLFEQYTDVHGMHCNCYDGYYGVQCQHIGM